MKSILLILIFFTMTTTNNTNQNPETQMNGAQLDALMTGNSVYLIEPNSGGDMVLWYGADGRAMASLPGGRILNGTWAVKGDLSCIKWSYAPTKDSCSKLVRRDGAMVLLENGTNRLLGTVKKIVPGNVENL